MKQVSDYTDAELIEIGRRQVVSNIKSGEATKKKQAIMNKLFEAYKNGDLKVAGLPYPTK